MLATYKDAVDYLLLFLQGDSTGGARQWCRTAVQDAIREFAAFHPWTYYQGVERIVTVAPYATGTVTYTASNRQMTLAGGTWPSWSSLGSMTLGGLPAGGQVPYKVDTLLSSTVLRFRSNSCPTTDVTAPSTYQLFQSTYTLPPLALAVNTLVSTMYRRWLLHLSVAEIVDRDRFYPTPAQPRCYCVMGDPNYQGQLCVKLNPPPNIAEPFDFHYRRMPRALAIEAYDTGTVNVTTGLNLVNASGSASFPANCVGSVFRLGQDAVNDVGGDGSAFPAVAERIITASTPSQLTVDSEFSASATGVNYVISDPVDVEQYAMLNGFKATAKKQLARNRHMKDVGSIEQQWITVMKESMAADSRNMQVESPISSSLSRMGLLSGARLMDLETNTIGGGS